MHIRTQNPFLALALICLSCAVYFSGALAESQIDLTKSFRLRVSLVVERDDEHRWRYTFEEVFSSEQRRTKITYATLGQPGRDASLDIPAAGKLIASDASVLLWSSRESPESLNCQLLSWDQFKRLCHNQILDEVALNLLGGENAIRGPSAALLLVERYRDKLKRVNMMSSNVRNTPSVMFAHLDDKFQLYCLYSVEQVRQADNLSSHLPMRVILDLPDGLHLEYDFLHYEASRVYDQEANYPSEETHFDEFSIERATGCSAYASTSTISSEQDKLFSSDGQDTGRSYSFAASVPESSQDAESSSRKVVYLNELGVMRVESESSSRTTSLLIDYNLGITHHVIERTEAHERADSALNRLMAPTRLDTDDATRSCILVESPPHPESSDFLQLLAGETSKSFIHLGRARVRGIWTRAYEAYNTTWPSWLVQPVVAYTKHHDDGTRADKQVREAYHDLLEAGLILSTVVYLSRGQMADDARLVQVEIYQVHHETKRVLDRVSIPILDFSWSPAQVDLASLSLANKCSFGESDAQRGRVEMLLTSMAKDATPLPDWLRDNHLRDVALLESIQSQLKIPISMLVVDQDFSSRLIEVGTPAMSSGLGAKLELNFGFVSSNKRSVARLTHDGTGRVKKLYQFKLFKSERSSLEACFYLAAHRKLNNFFAYSQHDSKCLIDFGPEPIMPNEDNDPEFARKPPRAKAFELDPNGPVEIYFVHHDLESNPSDLLRQLHAGAIGASGLANSQLMRMLPLKNPDDRNSPESHNWIIQSLELVDFNDNQQPFKIDDVSLESTNKFVNFGFMSDQRLTSRAEGEQSTDIEGCRAACLISTRCKSYSWCVSGASSECVLSSVGFKPGSDLLLQLVDIQQKRPLTRIPIGYRERHVHSLWVNATHSVRVKHQAGCELHNKLYLDMFHMEPRRRRQNLGEFGSLKPVDGRDQCAQRCFKMTLKALSEGDNLLATTNSQLEKLIRMKKDPLQTDDNSRAAEMDRILTSQRNAAKQMCREFYYLDAVNLHAIPADVRGQYQLSARLTADDEAQGYCLMMRAAGEKSQTKYDREATIDGLERYSFKFDLLYESHKNVRLLPSIRTPGELEAYRALMSRQLPENISDLEPLWGLIDKRKNSQTNAMMGHMDAHTCAAMCTTQITGPWPACKSFDLIVISPGQDSDGKPSAVCLLNSITMQDALETKQQQLIDRASSLTLSYWHYEPRAMQVAQHASGKTESNVPLPGQLSMAQRTTYLGLPSTMIMCICTIGFITGVLMGLNLGLKYSTNLHRASRGLLSDPTADTNQDFSLSIEAGIDSSELRDNMPMT